MSFDIRKTFLTGASVLILMVFFGGCAGCNRIGRSYEQKPFDSASWRNGDAQIRGTMFVDLTRKRIVKGKSKDEVLALLGEPDRKSTVADTEIWHYKLEFAGAAPTQEFSVTFDKTGKAGTRVSLQVKHFGTEVS